MSSTIQSHDKQARFITGSLDSIIAKIQPIEPPLGGDGSRPTIGEFCLDEPQLEWWHCGTYSSSRVLRLRIWTHTAISGRQQEQGIDVAKKDAGRKPAEKSAERKKKQAAQSKSTSTKQIRREQAAALFEEAMDIRNPIQRSVLLERVVDLDPGDIDAWVELADIEPDLEEAKGMLQTAIRHGCKQLQNELKADRGMFWTLPHTRPFMRAKFDLARVHRDQGNLEDATIILEELLDLNEMDNQAARWHLMDFYLRQDQIDDAEKLIARFPDDTLPFLAFTAVLVAFRKQGDSDNVRQQLKKLAQRNPHIIS